MAETKTKGTVEERVMGIIVHSLGEPQDKKVKLTRESNLAGIYEFDSLDRVEFLMDLENEFDVGIPDEDAEKMFTMGPGDYQTSGEVEGAYVCDIIKYLEGRLKT